MAPLRRVFAGGTGGAIGAGIAALVSGLALGGPPGWVVLGAVAVGALYGAAGAAVGAATVSQAFQDGLMSGFRVGREVFHIFRRTTGPGQPAGLLSGVQPTHYVTGDVEELRNDAGFRVPWDSATCDLDISTQSSGSPTRFRMATGLAATCDECHKVLSVGSDWYHERGTQRDLCAKHRSGLPPTEREAFCCVDSDQVLGSNSRAYALTVRVPVDAFPQVGPQAEGEVVLEVSHLINRNDREATLASVLKPLMPNTRIEEQPGPRSFCRISVDMKDEAVVREVIKSVGKQRNKRVSIKEISRDFHSPRS